jgi:uncharacterized membrane protein HdeD (DUF308 family)
MKTSKELRKKWLVYAVSGILLMGFGLSVLGSSSIAKFEGETFFYWFLMGTGGLVLFFSGLSIFGQAVVYKGFLDKKK